MGKAERAKIFASFAALKGFQNALHEKEKIIVSPAEISEDRMEEIDRLLHEIVVGDIVNVVYHNGEVYQKLTGCVTELSQEKKYISVVNTKISFDLLYDVTIEEYRNEMFCDEL